MVVYPYEAVQTSLAVVSDGTLLPKELESATFKQSNDLAELHREGVFHVGLRPTDYSTAVSSHACLRRELLKL
jgi:hypothetical protein